MAVHRTLLSFLSLFYAGCIVLAANTFENTAIVRSVDLGGSLTHVRTTYAAKSLEDGSRIYTLALGKEQHEKLGFLEVKVKGTHEPLELTPFGKSLAGDAFLYTVKLPKSLNADESVNLEVEAVLNHASRPFPETVAQDDPQFLLYESDLFVLSPYSTVVQRTKIRAPNPNIKSFTEPKGLEAFTFDAPATKSGATVTYGPYNNIPPSANVDFTSNTQQTVSVRYKYEEPVMEIKSLNRVAEISHWGSNLNIQDDIFLQNGGPPLKGQFARWKHQHQQYYSAPAAHIIRGLSIGLPPGIRDAYYTDIVGNVSTSRLRVAPSVPKGSAPKQFSLLEFRPRYPMTGGWNYTFTLGWDAPLQDSVSYDPRSSTYTVGIPVWSVIPGVAVDEAKVKITLPEGATDLEIYPPFAPKKLERSVHTTYLDTTGRPAITLTYEKLTDRHNGVIYISYKVPFTAHMRKPLAVASAFFGLFTLAVAFRRVDTRIHKSN